MSPIHKTLLAFALLLAACAGLLRLPVDWQTLPAATCVSLEGCFCEAPRPGAVRQPANAWSSLAFAGVGLWAAFHSQTRRPGGLGAAQVGVFSAALGLIGLGSAFYHASLSLAGQFLDVMGMYLLGTFLLVFNLNRLRPLRGPAFAALYALLNLALAALLLARPEWRRYAFLGLILAVLALEALARARGRGARAGGLLFALGCMALAFLIWNLDNSGLWCAPGSLLQGHAVWHLLGAAAALGMYRYLQETAGDEGINRTRLTS